MATLTRPRPVKRDRRIGIEAVELAGRRVYVEPARLPVPPEAGAPERPIWQTVAFLLVFLGIMIVLEIALAFGVARIVTGHAY